MSERCGVCGKIFSNEPKFEMETGKQMCETCYLAFLNEEENENRLDEKTLEILKNKELYTKEKLAETLMHLKEMGNNTKEIQELKEYIKSLKSDDEEQSKIYSNGNTYMGSKSNIWSNYVKAICYIFWGLDIILGVVIGALIVGAGGGAFFGGLIGGVVGFILGFVTIAIIMVFITLCENISIIADNSAKILAKLDEGYKAK